MFSINETEERHFDGAEFPHKNKNSKELLCICTRPQECLSCLSTETFHLEVYIQVCKISMDVLS